MNRHLNNKGKEFKTGHAKGTAFMGEGGLKREVKEVNMVDVFSVKE
jgi:hypothetical protein